MKPEEQKILPWSKTYLLELYMVMGLEREQDLCTSLSHPHSGEHH